MTNILQNEYHPDAVSPPGETLLETLEAIDMSQAELAKRMRRPTKTINEIIQGKAAITAETALQLESVLHIPASFWLKREQHYREALARLDQEKRLADWIGWLKEFPIREMVQRGWIPASSNKRQQVSEVLKFFGVASPDAWHAVWNDKIKEYSPSVHLEGDLGAMTAWLRQGEIEAQQIETAPYNAETFRDALRHIRALTMQPMRVFREEVIRRCAEAGVAVVFVQKLPKTEVRGATQWLSSRRAFIQLSMSYKTDDQFWCAFFHKAAHILFHGKRQFFLEIDYKDNKVAEEEADKFATDILIDPLEWQRFLEQHASHSKTTIQQFAQEMGIAPGIVVGRLQNEGYLPFGQYNELKRSLDWLSRERSREYYAMG